MSGISGECRSAIPTIMQPLNPEFLRNEPDSWGIFNHIWNESSYFETWRRAVTAIRSHNPRARIVGPSFARSYNCDTPHGPCGATGPNGTWDGSSCFGTPPTVASCGTDQACLAVVPTKLCGLSPLHNTTMRRFLEFGRANGVLPDILSWHEWSPQLKFLPAHVADVVSYLAQNPEVRPLHHLILGSYIDDSYLNANTGH
eukprot:COSAG05_NODE_957_length_6426_cov_16.557768_4_plen_200_part_00